MKILGFLLLWLGITTGIRGEPSVDQYGLKGGSICLAVPEPPEMIKGLKWMRNSDVIVGVKEISPKYKEKVDYNDANHSLCIKNLLNTDSGIYKANYRKKWNESTTTYRLLVQDHVPKPVMDVTSLFNTSVGLCDVTVNCSVKDGWMLSVCGGGQCTRSQQLLSLSGDNITISNGNGTIQCTTSNHVSTQTISQPMEDCSGEDGKAIVGSVIVVLLVAVLCVGCIIHARKRKIPKEQHSLEEDIVPRVYNSVNTSPGREARTTALSWPEPQHSPVQNHNTLLTRTIALTCPEPQHSPGQNHITLLTRTTALSWPEPQHSPGQNHSTLLARTTALS
ncbi:SLAM family member 9-like [Coregonus clupeaformis]|uniref:SLAM family member 9-like n=1 Tax=Coregonus clupeaformis TaxID=59861 RepID=UPI001E1C8DBA|nr:SLAM family member 9-like [Coregonus clupeaformis]